ncbi:hypothetical protein Bbelb_148430 [Branchiostoma belcheri]|nr:hypothetical protein Bbelb_148430 [Branchiostoma belcheri]
MFSTKDRFYCVWKAGFGRPTMAECWEVSAVDLYRSGGVWKRKCGFPDLANLEKIENKMARELGGVWRRTSLTLEQDWTRHDDLKTQEEYQLGDCGLMQLTAVMILNPTRPDDEKPGDRQLLSSPDQQIRWPEDTVSLYSQKPFARLSKLPLRGSLARSGNLHRRVTLGLLAAKGEQLAARNESGTKISTFIDTLKSAAGLRNITTAELRSLMEDRDEWR